MISQEAMQEAIQGARGDIAKCFVSGLGSRVSGLGLGFGVSDLTFKVYGQGLRVRGLGQCRDVLARVLGVIYLQALVVGPR